MSDTDATRPETDTRSEENTPIDRDYVRKLEERVRKLEEGETDLKQQLVTAYSQRLEALQQLRQLRDEMDARADEQSSEVLNARIEREYAARRESMEKDLESRQRELDRSYEARRRELEMSSKLAEEEQQQRFEALRQLRKLRNELDAQADDRRTELQNAKLEREYAAKREVLEQELASRQRELERSFTDRQAELEMAGKLAEMKQQQRFDAREQELEDLRQQTEREIQNLRREAEQKIDAMHERAEQEYYSYRDDTRRSVQAKVEAFGDNFNYYLQQLKGLMEKLVSTSMQVGDTFLASDAEEPGELFKKRMGAGADLQLGPLAPQDEATYDGGPTMDEDDASEDRTDFTDVREVEIEAPDVPVDEEMRDSSDALNELDDEIAVLDRQIQELQDHFHGPDDKGTGDGVSGNVDDSSSDAIPTFEPVEGD